MKIYSSPLCPDCTFAKGVLQTQKITDYELVEVTESMKNLREFIYFREANSRAFDPMRPKQAIGLPFFVLDDGRITFDVFDALGIDAGDLVGKTCDDC